MHVRAWINLKCTPTNQVQVLHILTMVARRKKEYSTGEASNYVSRKQAMRKLQLNLKVRRLKPMIIMNLILMISFFRTFAACAS